MRIIGIVQARMGSSRLPGKVLMEINGMPMIHWVLSRSLASKDMTSIVVATSISPSDDILANWLDKNGYNIFRGSENDVLSRYYECAKKIKADLIVRITADDPLKDAAIIDKAISFFKENPNLDYVSNTIKPTYPEGLDIEVMTFDCLQRLHVCSVLASEREHVTAYITHNPSEFNVINFESKEDLSLWRWTVDKPADFEFVKKIFEKFESNPLASSEKIIDFIKEHPELLDINSGTERMEGYLKSRMMEKNEK